MARRRRRLYLVFSWPRIIICLILLGLIGGAYLIVPRVLAFNVDGVIDTDTTTSLVFHTLDVGQGDCLIVQFPDEKVLMVDTGTNAAYDTITAYLDKIQVHQIDWLVITHLDSDHYGSAAKLLADPDLHFETLYWTNYEKNDKSLIPLKQLNKFQVPEDGLSLGGAEYTLTFVSPYHDDVIKNSNDSSLMLTIEYYDKLFVLTGDAGKATDSLFIPRASAIFADKQQKQIILKVSHHGSSTASSAEFLQFVYNDVQQQNNFAVISCGNKTEYGHPNDDVLERLQEHCVTENILITHEIGDIVFAATAQTLTVNEAVVVKGVVLNVWAYSTIYIVLGLLVVQICFSVRRR